MLVKVDGVKQAIAAHGGIPGQPKLEVSFENVDEDGWGEMVLSSPHATPESVLRALGIRVPPRGSIRKTTPSTAGHVASEPHRPRTPEAEMGAAAVTTLRPPDEQYVSSEPRSRVRRRG